MNIGMLWFDRDTKSTLEQRIQRAADYYQKKYGRKATACFLHPAMIPQGENLNGEIEICPNDSILPNHFWLGIKDDHGQVHN